MRLNIPGVFAFLILGSIIGASCGSEEKAVAPPQEITVVEAIQKDVPIYREFIGEVYGEKDIPIRARVEGFLEGLLFEEGGKVTAGQLLYTIDPRPLEADVNAQQSQVAEARTMLAKAESDLNRYKPLAKLNAVSQSDLDDAQAQYDASLASVNAAEANLRSAQIELGYTKIYSPIDGIIGMSEARVGDFVGKDPNPVILNTVSQTNNMKVRFYLTESDYLYISRKYIEKVDGMLDEDIQEDREPNIELILSDESVYEHKGLVDFIDRNIDPNTGSILVQASFPNPQLLLRPGLYAKVKLSARTEKDAILIPLRCTMELQGRKSVYIANDTNIVESRSVTVGPIIGDYVLIEDGLKAGDKVVIDALQKVRPDMVIVPKVIEFKSQTNPEL